MASPSTSDTTGIYGFCVRENERDGERWYAPRNTSWPSGLVVAPSNVRCSRRTLY